MDTTATPEEQDEAVARQFVELRRTWRLAKDARDANSSRETIATLGNAKRDFANFNVELLQPCVQEVYGGGRAS